MPQLNPHPWFLILILTWTILLSLFLNKTLTMLLPNTPTEPQSETKYTSPWTWPWH